MEKTIDRLRVSSFELDNLNARQLREAILDAQREMADSHRMWERMASEEADPALKAKCRARAQVMADAVGILTTAVKDVDGN